MHDYIERERSFGRAMLADLTGRPGLEGPATALPSPPAAKSRVEATLAYPKAAPDVLAASWRNAVADVAGTYDAALRVMRDAEPMLLVVTKPHDAVRMIVTRCDPNISIGPGGRSTSDSVCPGRGWFSPSPSK